NLYPVQSGMSALGHTDDYPGYSLTLAGADGQEITIFSGNTANGFGAPWTISAGGQLYAQYDGALVPPLAKLLGDEARLPARDERFLAGIGPQRDPRAIVFEASGFPAGGYLSDTSAKGIRIDYTALPPVIAGTISIDDNEAAPELIDLKKPDESSAICEWSIDEERTGGSFRAYAFSCPVPEAAAGQDYAYALFVRLAGQGPMIVRLTGAWAAPYDARLLLPPVQWQAAAAGDPAIQELLSDHLLLHLSYSAIVDATDPLSGTLQGDALLIGQGELEGRPVRYSVETPFAITDGTLTRWDLDRASLDSLLADALAQPLTRRVLEADPQAIINLRYIAKPVPEPEGMGLWGNSGQAQQIEILACGAVPGGTVPSAAAPLRGWSYNQDFGGWQRDTEFVLLDGKLIAANLDLFGPDDSRFKGAIYDVLAPEGVNAPLDRIWLVTDSFWGDKPVLTIWGASADQLAPLKLPAASGDEEWEGVTLRVDDDGRLRPEVCR
ncbi:MAG TPA: hypothetical protein VGE07_25295, partial [Herpetosiphonaceae bacterium]